MTIAFWCVLIAMFLPYVFVVMAKVNAPGLNNHAPRDVLKNLSGWKARANWAHLNAFEAFPPFAAAVVISHLVNGATATADMLAMIFVLARILHGVFYIIDKPTLRSLVWFVGILCVVLLFCI